MNKSKKNYKNKCKRRNIDFYLHEEDLYKYSKTINFNKFVKDCLRCEMWHDKLKKDGDVAVCISDFDDLI